ncbi:MAG TPA: ATP-binding protein [Coleofasciculaceae cyanobacterium]|jgi:signal transduction histidine kinase
MLSSRGKVLGTFAIYYREPRRPTLKDLQLIEIAAHIAGIAIECKQVEKERSRLIAILEASTDYIGTTDPQGNSLWNNAQMKKIVGLSFDANVGKQRISDYYPQWALEVIQNQGLPTAIRDGIWVGETALLRHDEVEIPVSQMIIAHKSPDGSLEYFSTIMHDLSKQLDDKADKYIAYVSDGAMRMQALITDLLTYSRVGKGELTKQSTDLEVVLNQTLTDLGRVISESKAVIITDPLPKVKANPLQMGQLLQNLIANAIKFRGKQSPQIQIKAARHDQSWTISVQDNGIGMQPQSTERIFVIFQRLHTRDEYPGTGIGLAVCKKIVERHGGRIWVESEPGRGTTFSFTLPLQ